MGKIYKHIRSLFLFFNGLFAVIGCMMIIGLLRATPHRHKLETAGSPNLGCIWMFAIGILYIAGLGVYAGRKENTFALKIFAGFMGDGLITMTIFGIILTVERNEVKSRIQAVQPFMYDMEMRELLNKLQKEVKCCGLVSAEDWGDDIPSSCGCNLLRGSDCKSKPQGTSGPSFIYKQLLGLLMSLLMIHQIKRHDSAAGASFAMTGY
ncbi:23 kDa integral membrane protein-like isoform X2 [Micropterus salmoides]|uniref:23 kDa integral membrane protein-like isoform X2 n=1 Tax=Micropterus salmoides TaxID=27706 RepID=UPI0018EC52CE|nr:23 kDa integral membrane protein-like isoform X2 [Micropterus salmoides]XP_038568585.1 23 kDa integral membrane protein-like isoform X2 [Micropterus salmoides]